MAFKQKGIQGHARAANSHHKGAAYFDAIDDDDDFSSG